MAALDRFYCNLNAHADVSCWASDLSIHKLLHLHSYIVVQPEKPQGSLPICASLLEPGLLNNGF